MVSGTWEGRGSRKRLGEHMGVGVGVWGLGVGFWGLGFQIALEIILRTVFAQNAAESEAVGSSDWSWSEEEAISSDLP